MNKSRWSLLLTILAMLIFPISFTSKAGPAHNRDSDTDEVSITGNVKVRGTPSGHLTVAVDKSFPLGGLQADGVVDVLFHFVPKKSKFAYRNIIFDFENASVGYTDRRLTVLSMDRHVLVNLMLDRDTKSQGLIPYYIDRDRDVAETVRISRGKALVRYLATTQGADGFWLCGAEGGRCSIRENAGGIKPSSGGAPDCPSGGAGSSSCSISCGAGQGCSTGCSNGYYACCHCTNGCHCVKGPEEQ